MILTHGANSLSQGGGGGVTPPEGWEIIPGLFSSYGWDLNFIDVNTAPVALAGKNISELEIEINITMRSVIGADTGYCCMFVRSNSGLYVGGDSDGLYYRLGAKNAYWNSEVKYAATDVPLSTLPSIKINLYRNNLTATINNNAYSTSDIIYTAQSAGGVCLFDMYNNNYEKPYYINRAVVRDHTTQEILFDCYPVKKIADGSLRFWDAIGNTFGTGDGVGLYE